MVAKVYLLPILEIIIPRWPLNGIISEHRVAQLVHRSDPRRGDVVMRISWVNPLLETV